MTGALLVFVGGGLGAVARHGVNRLAFSWLGPAFPWGTLAVNVVGSLAMGLLIGLFAALETGQATRLFLTTGFLGGFTTFSAFSLDALVLYQRGEPALAVAYVSASVLLSLTAVAAGFAVSRLA